MITDSDRFKKAITLFDEANSEDPNKEVFEGVEFPKELLYSKRMTSWLEKFAPDASEELRLAARCQHIRRWTIRRSDYPLDRQGYKKWRSDLAEFHAQIAGEILRNVGYDQETVRRVGELLKKEKLKIDSEVQTLEDVICLVFLESYFAEFSKKHEEEKLIGIIRKTWRKMSSSGHEAVLSLDLSPHLRKIVEKALGDN